MVDYREILRLSSASEKMSVRDILTSAHCSYRTYRATIDAAKAKGINWPLDDDVSNEQLQAFPCYVKIYIINIMTTSGCLLFFLLS